MIHTGPIHIRAHETEDGECDECEGICAITEPLDYPNFQAMLAAGWAWDCAECGTCTDDEEDADGNELFLDPVCTVYTDVNEPCHVFCTPDCHDAFFARAARLKADKQRMLDAIARLWPDAVKTEAHRGWISKSTDGPAQMIAQFDLPAGLRVKLAAVSGEIQCFSIVGEVTPAIKALADDARAKWASVVSP